MPSLDTKRQSFVYHDPNNQAGASRCRAHEIDLIPDYNQSPAQRRTALGRRRRCRARFFLPAVQYISNDHLLRRLLRCGGQSAAEAKDAVEQSEGSKGEAGRGVTWLVWVLVFRRAVDTLVLSYTAGSCSMTGRSERIHSRLSRKTAWQPVTSNERQIPRSVRSSRGANLTKAGTSFFSSCPSPRQRSTYHTHVKGHNRSTVRVHYLLPVRRSAQFYGARS